MNFLSQLQPHKLLKDLSTFGIGGPARFFYEASNCQGMQEVLSFCHKEKLPFLIVGKGSNCLFDDRGFDGVVILNKIGFCKMEGMQVQVGAGYSFSLLGVQTARKGLSGLEFASGIPASVGGAIYMNAGASLQETSTCLQSVDFVNEKGELEHYEKSELEFGYRTSSFQKKKGAIVGACFILTTLEEARKKQLAIVEYRTQTQPYGDKSAGCVFRNPKVSTAGALIERSGLKGHSIGGAQVSTLHANFIVNTGDATAKDVLALAKHIRETVNQKMGIELEMEIRCIPYQAQ